MNLREYTKGIAKGGTFDGEIFDIDASVNAVAFPIIDHQDRTVSIHSKVGLDYMTVSVKREWYVRSEGLQIKDHAAGAPSPEHSERLIYE